MLGIVVGIGDIRWREDISVFNKRFGGNENKNGEGNIFRDGIESLG